MSMLQDEEVKSLKKRIIQHIDSTFPEDKREEGKAQIASMSNEDFEKFLKQNKLIQEGREKTYSKDQECPFCLISSGKIKSHKIDENKDAVAVLEINPISIGHTLIIPKKHLNRKKISKSIYSFADRISKKIRSDLKPKGIITSEDSLFGHKIINIVPIYKNETMSSKRHSASNEELSKIQEILLKNAIIKKNYVKKPVKRSNKKVKEKSKNSKHKKKTITKHWLPKRIP